ncbi:MAG: NAD(P)/FAD-dependent oxidoreductase [Bacteroidales bacterium]|nr:NAD(P)/FAD-dependent oxidoreductase [Bacteroidales bacterium]
MESIVIVGGGLGGLFTGAILAKEGLKVTVIEKNSTVGGGLQSFTRMGEVFDTGMHIIGGMQEDGNVRKVCRYLGIEDKIHIRDVDPDIADSIYFAEDGHSYHTARGRENYVKALSEDFPGQEKNLKEYVDAMYRITDEVDMFHLRPNDSYVQPHCGDFGISAKDFIAKYISDTRLRSVLAFMNPMYGGRGAMTPAYVHAIISVLYIEGASRFEGGSCRFAQTLKESIEDNGGTVISGDGVARVCTEGRFIKGVVTRSGKSFTADKYICAIHPSAFFSLLDDKSALPKSYRDRLESIPSSYSAFKLNIKFKKGTFKYLNHTCYYMSRYDDIWNFGCDSSLWPEGFLYMTPPEIGQGEYATKMIVTAPMLWECVSPWEDSRPGHRTEEYGQFKKEMSGRILDCLEKLYPDFRSCIEGVDSSSPLTIRDWYSVKEGAMCGYSKDWTNPLLTQVPVVTKIPNLLLTGQCCNLHGFCGVTLTAINTAEAALGSHRILEKLNFQSFDDLRPYYDSEIPAAMQRIVSDPAFPKVVSAAFPGKSAAEVAAGLSATGTVRDFQQDWMLLAVKNIVASTCTEFTFEGFENVSPDTRYLFVSNHRDIMLDASILEMVLMDAGLDSSEITFGANLMRGQMVIDIGKSNKMFKVERPGGNLAEFLKSSKHLSDYISATILQKKQSVWIANRNGRTKDGLDRTDQGIVKMFAMCSPASERVQTLASLHILPLSISYEWEPCDVLKTLELAARRRGPYVKKPGEDLTSILTGVLQNKGRIHLAFCPVLTEEDLRQVSGKSANEYYKNVAAMMDRRICGAYKLWPNNYLAHDLREGKTEYSDRYSPAEKEAFISHLEQLEKYAGEYSSDELKGIFLDIYANPVDSKILFGGK